MIYCQGWFSDRDKTKEEGPAAVIAAGPFCSIETEKRHRRVPSEAQFIDGVSMWAADAWIYPSI
jgi:hypothetical protein